MNNSGGTAEEDRLQRLVILAGALSRATSVEAVCKAAVAAGTAQLQADSVSVCVLDDVRNVYDIVAAGGLREEDAATWASFPRDAPVPVVDAVREDEMIIIRDLDDRRTRYPVLGQHRMVSETFVVAPMHIDEQVATGAFVVGFTTVRELTGQDRSFIQAVADLCGQAIHRARLLEYQQRSLLRQRFLADAGHVLAELLDHEHTLARVARLAVGELADACLVMLEDDDGNLRTVAAAHAEDHRQQLLDQMSARRPTVTSPTLLEAMRSGEAVFMPVVGDDVRTQSAEDEEHRQQLEAFGVTSGIVVPLRARDRTLGLLLLLLTSERWFTIDDRALAEALASRAALAIDNARLATEREQLVNNLKIALESRTVIEQAKGVLAEHHGITPAEAFDRMRRAARYQRRKLDALAEEVLDGNHDVLEQPSRS